jgi:arsenate reductase
VADAAARAADAARAAMAAAATAARRADKRAGYCGVRTMSAKPTIVIWHNPRCSKSRGTLEWLHQRGIEPAVIDYQKNPPSAAEIEAALQVLGMQPRELMRKGEAVYAELGLDDVSLTRKQLIAAMAAHPRLIERPIVFANGKAAIGRPPESVLAIL